MWNESCPTDREYVRRAFSQHAHKLEVARFTFTGSTTIVRYSFRDETALRQPPTL